MSEIPLKHIGGNAEFADMIEPKSVNNDRESAFETVINEAINQVSQVQNDAETAVNELSSGGDITNAVLAIEKADMTFQMMVEVRNKLLKSYEEVMRMQV